MDDRSMREQTLSGVRKALGWVCGILTFGMLAISLPGILYPSLVDPNSPMGRHPLSGWLLFLVGTTIMVVTVKVWAKAIPSLFAYGMLIGLLEIVQGHRLNQPPCPYGRLEGVIDTLILAACTTLTFRFKERSLSVADRVAVVAFVYTFIWGVAFAARDRVGNKPCRNEYFSYAAVMGIGVFCLFIAWIYDHIRRPKLSQGGRGTQA